MEKTSSYPELRTEILTPSIVKNVEATPARDNIALNWQAPLTVPNNLPIQDYEIQYRQAYTSTWNTLNDGVSTELNATISNLDESTQYSIRVRAKNAEGFGPFSRAILVTTSASPGSTSTNAKGDGSVDNPYQISTCDELQALNESQYEYDIDAPGNYVLVNDIDCSDTINWNDGAGFIPLNSNVLAPDGANPRFNQYFDGRNHSIINLYMNSDAHYLSLFNKISNKTSVKNLNLVNTNLNSTRTSEIYIAALASFNEGTIENVNVEANLILQGNLNVAGGLVANNTGSISRSSTKGFINQTNSSAQFIYLGGLVGITNNGALDNTYSSVAINNIAFVDGVSICGGLFGGGSESTVNHSYASGPISCTNTTTENVTSGSFGGYSSSQISNSFASGQVTPLAANWGGFTGEASGSEVLTNDYYDISSGGQLDCSQEPNPECHNVNIGLSDINYFKNNSTNAPLNTWDFANVWSTTDSYPVLKPAKITPARPENLLGVTTVAQATLTWDAPTNDGGAPITDYEIQYKKSNSSTWSAFEDGISASTSTIVTGLDEGQIYDYRVRAINENGFGLYSLARTEIQLQTQIQSPPATEFEYGDTLTYRVSVHNTSPNPISSIDTTFLAAAFNIDSITLDTGVLGNAPSNIGSITNNTNWNGLLETNQEIVFVVTGTVNAAPNTTGQLSFSGATIISNGQVLDASTLGGPGRSVSRSNDSVKSQNTINDATTGVTISAQSQTFVVKESATDFNIQTELSEDQTIDKGDPVHITYKVFNKGPKAGFFTNTITYLYIPDSIAISEIENDYLLCSAPVTIDQNLTAGIYAQLQGHKLVQCAGTGGKIANVNEDITINLTGNATRDLNAGDVISRAMFLSTQDQDTVTLSEALSTTQNIDVFSSENNNVSKLIYTKARVSSKTDSGNVNNEAQTPSSKESSTSNKASQNSGTSVINKIADAAAINASLSSTDNAYKNLPQVKDLIDRADGAIDSKQKKLVMSKLSAKQSLPFTLVWFFMIVIGGVIVLVVRQKIILHKTVKKLHN